MNTTYTVKSKKDKYVWEFKYDMDGSLKSYKILEGKLAGTQMEWLFSSGNFPANENVMKNVWMQKLKKNFEVSVGEPDLSFETFYNTFGNKIKKNKAEAAWKKLSKADKILALQKIKSYKGYLKRKQVAQMNPEAYINQKRWEDDFDSIH
jgi:hypothetical protein